MDSGALFLRCVVCSCYCKNHESFSLEVARVAARQQPAHARLVFCVHILVRLHWQAHNPDQPSTVQFSPVTEGVQYPRTHARAAAATQSVNGSTSHTSRGAEHTPVRTPCQQRRVCTSNLPTASVHCMHHSGPCPRHKHTHKLASRNATPRPVCVDSTQNNGVVMGAVGAQPVAVAAQSRAQHPVPQKPCSANPSSPAMQLTSHANQELPPKPCCQECPTATCASWHCTDCKMPSKPLRPPHKRPLPMRCYLPRPD